MYGQLTVDCYMQFLSRFFLFRAAKFINSYISFSAVQVSYLAVEATLHAQFETEK